MKFTTLSLSLCAMLAIGCTTSVEVATVPKIIYDTDFGNDADDLGALTILNNLENEGRCEVLAVMSYFPESDVIAGIDATNNFYGNDFPLAISSRGYYTAEHSYNKAVADAFPHRQTNASVPLCVDLYRQILAEADDNSITIVVVGPLGNIKQLIDSPADATSPLTGAKLIEQKVKSFSIMGGGYPSIETEWNFNGNNPGTTRYVLESIKRPMAFIDYNAGCAIKIGDEFNSLEGASPLKSGFMHFSENASWMNKDFVGKILNNSSFDQLAMYHGIYGNESPYYDMIAGEQCVAAEEKGANTWISNPESNHTYMRLKEDVEPFRGEILRLMTLGL